MNVTNLLMKTELVEQTFLGNKNMTRREVKPGKDRDGSGCDLAPCEIAGEINNGDYSLCPYGGPGDLIYIKETFWAFGRWETRYSMNKGRDEHHFVDMTHLTESGYQFEEPGLTGKRGDVVPAWHKRPSIFMPRKASRLTLRIKSVRVERLGDISEEDAGAEGVTIPPPHIGMNAEDGSPIESEFIDWAPTDFFRDLWELVHGPGAWERDKNKWMWVIEYEPIFENVDAFLEREAA